MLTNAIFLGQLSMEALGNAGITGVFYLIFAVAGNGLSGGLQTVFSSAAGADRPHLFKIIIAQGVRISLALAIFCICFTWFAAPIILKQFSTPASYQLEVNFLKIRVMGLPFLFLFQVGNAFLVSSLNSRYLMVGFICEATMNILLDYLLIFGNGGFPAMGFNGAATASVIAEIMGMSVVLTVLIFTGLNKKYLLFSNFSYVKKISKQVLKVAVPLVLQYVISVSTWLIFFLMIETKGAIAKAISNTMRNVFGLVGVFVWAFAATCNNMVSNLLGQQREDLVLLAIKKIMYWSLGLCSFMCVLINIFPAAFFHLFGQSEEFVQEAIPVVRMVSLGFLFMSIANVWLNGVTGTGKTQVNLLIEIVAICLYLVYTLYFMKVNYISLAMAWSNEFIYWTSIFLMAFWYLKCGNWKKKKSVS